MQGLILLNKPAGITSAGAVARIRRITGEKRVGHTGTLDPMATGVLPVLLGRATALSGLMLDADKRYTAGIKLGVATDTEDITGSIVSEKPVTVTAAETEAALKAFTGKNIAASAGIQRSEKGRSKALRARETRRGSGTQVQGGGDFFAFTRFSA